VATARFTGVPTCAQVVKMVAKRWGTQEEQESSEAMQQAASEEMGGMLHGSMESYVASEKARCYTIDATEQGGTRRLMIRVMQKEWR